MITIAIPISRRNYLKAVFDCLEKLERPKDTELIIIIDGDEELKKAIDKRLDQISYAHIKVLHFGEKPAETIDDRRYRISAIHNKLKHEVSDDCDYVMLLEDDTVYPGNSLTELLGVFKAFDNVGYVQGVEMGRHKTKYIGGWIADNNQEPEKIESVLPSNKMIERISAGGLYCCLVLANLYKDHTFEPYDKQGTVGLSCDVNFGLWINSKGYDCYMDWNIVCPHLTMDGEISIKNTTPVRVNFTRISSDDAWFARTYLL